MKIEKKLKIKSTFVASKLYGVDATIIIFVFVLYYCIIIFVFVLYCIVLYCILFYFIVLQ